VSYDHNRFILKKAINYVAQFKNDNAETGSKFPVSISIKGKKNINNRLGWCYGDLGIGIRFWYAAKVLQDKTLGNEAIKILKHAANRRSFKDTMVIDASICHGSFGIAQIFNRMYKETKDPVFKDATEFWIQDGLDKAIHKDGLAGYKQWKGEDIGWTNEVSLLEGISGIGLVILDYLTDYNTSWDECLLIS